MKIRISICLNLNFRALLCLLTSSRLPLSTLFPALSSAFPRRAGVKKRPCQNQKRSFHLFSKTIQVNIHNLDTLHDSTNKILQGSGSFLGKVCKTFGKVDCKMFNFSEMTTILKLFSTMFSDLLLPI